MTMPRFLRLDTHPHGPHRDSLHGHEQHLGPVVAPTGRSSPSVSPFAALGIKHRYLRLDGGRALCCANCLEGGYRTESNIAMVVLVVSVCITFDACSNLSWKADDSLSLVSGSFVGWLIVLRLLPTTLRCSETERDLILRCG